MPPLETSIAVETEEIARIKYHIAPELKDLCLMIKIALVGALEKCERAERTEMFKSDGAQNPNIPPQSGNYQQCTQQFSR